LIGKDVALHNNTRSPRIAKRKEPPVSINVDEETNPPSLNVHIEADAEEENEYQLYFPESKKGVALARDDSKRKQSSATEEEPRKRDQKALDKKHGRQENLKKAPNVKKRLFNALTEEANSLIEEVKEGKNNNN
jgi:hypothetical protein